MLPKSPTISDAGRYGAGERCWPDRRRRRFEALQHAIVPLSAGFDEARRRTSLELVDRALKRQPPAVRRQFGWLLVGIDAYCLFRYRRTFRRLPNPLRQRVLRALSRSRSARLREGMDGLATLAKLGAYGQFALQPILGYRLRENDG